MISLKIVTRAQALDCAVGEAAGYLKAIQELPSEFDAVFDNDLAVITVSIELWEKPDDEDEADV